MCSIFDRSFIKKHLLEYSDRELYTHLLECEKCDDQNGCKTNIKMRFNYVDRYWEAYRASHRRTSTQR